MYLSPLLLLLAKVMLTLGCIIVIAFFSIGLFLLAKGILIYVFSPVLKEELRQKIKHSIKEQNTKHLNKKGNDLLHRRR